MQQVLPRTLCGCSTHGKPGTFPFYYHPTQQQQDPGWADELSAMSGFTSASTHFTNTPALPLSRSPALPLSRSPALPCSSNFLGINCCNWAQPQAQWLTRFLVGNNVQSDEDDGCSDSSQLSQLTRTTNMLGAEYTSDYDGYQDDDAVAAVLFIHDHNNKSDDLLQKIGTVVSQAGGCGVLQKCSEYQAEIEATLLSMLDPLIGCERGLSYRAVCTIVENFWLYMCDIGQSPEFLWKKKEIVGVGVTDGMSHGHRRHFDLVACACANKIVDSFISEFEVLYDMMPAYVGPFMGRLFEMASRDLHQSLAPHCTALKKSIVILKKLMWVPHCRHLFIPFANQLQVILDHVRTELLDNSTNEMLTCCVNLVSVLPQFVQDFCNSYLSRAVKDIGILRRWVWGWDILPVWTTEDVVDFLKQRNITFHLITSLLQACCKEESPSISLTMFLKWGFLADTVLSNFIEEILPMFGMLCSVDPQNGHKGILQFVEDHIERSNLVLKSYSALMLIPVIFTGGAVDENVLMKALMFACSDGSPPILEVLFSLKEVFDMVTSTGAIELLFEKALERHNKGSDGLLFQMLKLCAVRVRNLLFRNATVEFITPIQNSQEAEAPRKRPLEERTRNYVSVLEVYYSRQNVETFNRGLSFTVAVSSIHLEPDSVNYCFLLVAASAHIVGSQRFGDSNLCDSSHFTNLMTQCCYYSPSMIEENEEVVLSLLRNVTDRRAFMQEILYKCKRNSDMEQKWCPLLSAVLFSEIQPLIPTEPRKLPRALSNVEQSSGGQDNIQQLILQWPSITDCFDNVLRWLLTTGGSSSTLTRLFMVWPVDPTKVTFEVLGEKQSVTQWAMKSGDFGLIRQLLPLCKPGHIPSSLIVDAVERGFRGIADLLLCHGVCIPESTLNDGSTLKIQGQPVDAHHPSVWRFFNSTPKWDPQQHRRFPWWFKVHILKTVLLCWLHSATSESGYQQGHFIGRLSQANVHHILSFLSPVHWH
ncbi:hypothetical protein Pelo_16766 [Pelomyxa schiedti]|nr:hypothetical protein Pelo_16766 [Pelomyxa schiedti]